MTAVIGYEEKDPAILDAMRAGYPRFFQHPLVKQLQQWYRQRYAVADEDALFLVASELNARELLAFADMDGRIVRADDLRVVIARGDEGQLQRAAQYIQHAGCGVYSRQAEQQLVCAGVLAEPFVEQRAHGYSEARLLDDLRQLFGLSSDVPATLTRTGMAAFYAAFSAIRAWQEPRGRRRWVQLGWLYLDTSKILQRFLPEGDHVCFYTGDAIDHLEEYLAQAGEEVAAVVTEMPTNPLMRTFDPHRLRALCERYNIPLILDPSTSGMLNVDVLPWADVVVASLTKYTGFEGDVMAGLLALNPQSPWCNRLREPALRDKSILHPTDGARLAHQVTTAEEATRKINANACILAPWLEQHPAVKRVYWPLAEGVRDHYLRIARMPDAPGSLITFELHGRMADFYDRVEMVKGPSFGVRFSLLCPFMHLAHYDLTSTPEGCKYLREREIDPDLIRLSVGTEEVEQMIAVLDSALSGS